MSGEIRANEVSFSYSRGETILRGLNLRINAGGFLGIAGPNGAGKSTLLNLLCGSLRPDRGLISVDGKPVDRYGAGELAGKIAVVRQEFVPPFGFTVHETVLMARTVHFGQTGFESREDREIVAEALEATDTTRFAQRRLNQLSGGERQRVFIARALAQQTPILLLDEPTSFLDLRHQVRIYDLLKKAQLERGKTIVSVTHDINLAGQYCDDVLLLNTDARYVCGATTEVLTAEKVQEVFSVRVFSDAIGPSRYFVPLGEFAKESGQMSRKRGCIE